MLDTKVIEDISQRLTSLLPGGVQSIQKDVEKNFKAVLQNVFAELDLVTREEFDVQTEVLRRSRKKLEALEKRMAQLEQQISNQK